MNDHWQFHSYCKTQSKLLDLNLRAFWDLVPAHISSLFCYSPLHSCWTLFSSSINSIFVFHLLVLHVLFFLVIFPFLSFVCPLCLATSYSLLGLSFTITSSRKPTSSLDQAGSHCYAVPDSVPLLTPYRNCLSAFPVCGRIFQYGDLVSGSCIPRT